MRQHPSLTGQAASEPVFFKRLAWFFLAVSGVGVAGGLSPLGERAGWPLVMVMLGGLGLSLGCYFVHSVQMATRGGAALWRAQATGVVFPMPAGSHRSENPN